MSVHDYIAHSTLLRSTAKLLGSKRILVHGQSMKPILDHGDHVLVSGLRDKPDNLARGDVVLVRDPLQPTIHYVKCIAGLPGDELLIFNVGISVNGHSLDSPYWKLPIQTEPVPEQMWLLGHGEYFLLGINMSDSLDSRRFGPVGLHLIEGRVWLRCWPLHRCGPVKSIAE